MSQFLLVHKSEAGEGETMRSSTIEKLSIQDNQWYRIVHEMLSMAGIKINGSRPYCDIQIYNPDFFKLENACFYLC